MTTTVEQWAEWNRLCALERCEEETRAALRRFIHHRFRRYVETYAHTTAAEAAGACLGDARDSWHWFETGLRLRNTREGKAYKAWLWTHGTGDAAPDLARLESGATLILRDVVRECLRREVSPAFMRSLDAPLWATQGGPGETAVTLGDLLPSAAATRVVEDREAARLAEQEAVSTWDALPRRQRVALLARETGLALSHPEVVRVAGCAKSMLCAAYKEALALIAARVRSRFPDESPSMQADLAVRLFDTLRRRVTAWGRSEIGCARLFTIAGAGQSVPLETIT